MNKTSTTQTTAIVLSKEPTSENFLRLHLLTPSLGTTLALLRVSKKSPTPIDLFQHIETSLSNSQNPPPTS